MSIRINLIAIVFSLLFAGVSVAGGGHVQVVCMPGCMVFLDGAFKGATVEELGGFILQGVSEGVHGLKVVRVGYEPFQMAVRVRPDQVEKVGVSLWIRKETKPAASEAAPKTNAPASGKTGVERLQEKARSLFSKGTLDEKGDRGAIRVTSRPPQCFVKIKGLFWGEIRKTEPEWWARGVPAGSYEVICREEKKIVRQVIDLQPGEIYELSFDLVAGQCEDRTANRRVELKPFLEQEKRFGDERRRRIRTLAKTYGPLGRGRYRWDFGWRFTDPSGAEHEVSVRANWWARARGSRGSFDVIVDGADVGSKLAFGEPCVLEYPVLAKDRNDGLRKETARYLVQCFRRLKDHFRGFDIRQDLLTLRCGGYWESADRWVDEDLTQGRAFKLMGKSYVPFDFK